MAISNAFQSSARRDPFYQFNQFQKQHGVDSTTAPAIGGPSGYLEKNQDVAYNRFLANIGVGQADNNPFSQWARKQFGQTQLGYGTALAEDPTLGYQDYLGRLGFTDLYNQFLRLTPQARGENRNRYVGPIRTIADI